MQLTSTQTHGPVYEDSCVEFFFAPDKDKTPQIFSHKFHIRAGRGVCTYLILFYSALLHDISKSQSGDIIRDLKCLVGRENELFCHPSCDHGIRSAYYLKQKEKNKRIAFHSSAKIHPAFRKEKTPSKDILLCLLFWLADVADGDCNRVLAAATVVEKTAKVKAREKIETVRVIN